MATKPIIPILAADAELQDTGLGTHRTWRLPRRWVPGAGSAHNPAVNRLTRSKAVRLFPASFRQISARFCRYSGNQPPFRTTLLSGKLMM